MKGITCGNVERLVTPVQLTYMDRMLLPMLTGQTHVQRCTFKSIQRGFKVTSADVMVVEGGMQFDQNRTREFKYIQLASNVQKKGDVFSTAQLQILFYVQYVQRVLYSASSPHNVHHQLEENNLFYHALE